ncbi:hypothetical protein IWX90DRAFT_511672 [Phyllosticta citrichinensis]|uniref:RING-type domain-containing protein n=1 Tax=Phyllosticta citrichinensis TaxID=1130410 RepID=A0ABR1Y5J8_9PEZI
MLAGIPSPFKHGLLSSRSGTFVDPPKRSASNSASIIPWLAADSPPTFNPDLAQDDEEDAGLKELNSQLDILTAVFPHVQPEVFREMLNSFSEESRLHVITEALLKKQDKWVRGRHRAPPLEVEESETSVRLPTTEKFRGEVYKTAAKEALYAEFKGLSHSTIKAVLAESNYSYSRARPALLAVSSKSWRFSVTSFFTRRKVPSEDEHPLIQWQKVDPGVGGPLAPRLVATNSTELNKELYHTLAAPILAKQTKEQLQKDRAFANSINDEEAESAGEMYDCQCCFTPSSFEQMTVCSSSGHWICFRCVRFAINEALYGQGWARSISLERHTLNCIAPVAGGSCQGFVPQESLQRALLEEPDGQTTFSKLQQRAATDVLIKSQLPLTHCPFCHYAEVDDISLRLRLPVPSSLLARKFVRLIGGCVVAVLFFFLSPLLSLFVLLTIAAIGAVQLTTNFNRKSLFAPLRHSKARVLRRRMGQRFRCQNPACGRDSCISCTAEWRNPHTCHAKALVSLRQHVENAISNAVKRTCPRCHMSFVKSSGCNKLLCPCGYSMCYICRAPIGTGEGYGHFCPHFRERPGERCSVCDKCDLYQVDEEDVMTQRVAQRAEREWREMNKMSGKEGVTIAKDELKRVAKGDGKSKDFVRIIGKRPWEVLLDRIVDVVYV